MNSFKYCIRCGKLFTSLGSKTCQKCTDKEEEEFKIVKEYIYDNEGVNIVEVSKGTGVPVEVILKFLKEERLFMTVREGSITLVCEACGKAIQTGRYCSGCKKELENSFRNALDGTTKEKEANEAVERDMHRMFTASYRKRAE